jgi:PhnB protein
MKIELGGRVLMPLGPTFFSPCYGMLVDRYGVQWMVMSDTPQNT